MTAPQHDVIRAVVIITIIIATVVLTLPPEGLR